MGKFLRKIIGYIILIILICIIALSIRNTINPNYSDEKESTQSSYVTGNEINSDSLKLQKATVKRVVDGDTFIINIDGKDERVRLIGVDTPESVNPDESKNTPEGEEASKITKKLVPENTVVWLEYDKDMTDDYGRTLAYIWLTDKFENVTSDNMDKYMLNAKLLKIGTAKPMFISPNLKYEPEFVEIYGKNN